MTSNQKLYLHILSVELHEKALALHALATLQGRERNSILLLQMSQELKKHSDRAKELSGGAVCP